MKLPSGVTAIYGLLKKVKFVLDDAGVVLDLVNEWLPENCKTEKDYENSLYAFLHRRLDGVQITKQFGYGRNKADLAIGKDLLLELKHNLDSTAKFQRLIGQLEDLRELDKTVIVLLTGRTDPNLRKELEKRLEEMNHREFNPLATLGGYKQFLLVEK